MSESMSKQTAKKRAKERDGWECRFCGVTNDQHKQEFGRELHGHHIIKDKDGGADHPKNLITVCRDCHKTLEKTQADALSRIKEEHIGDKDETIEDLRERLQSERGVVEEYIEGVSDVITQQLSVDVYVVHQTQIVTSQVKYVGPNQEKAYEAFEECDNHATIETLTVRADEIAKYVDCDKVESGIVSDAVREVVEQTADELGSEYV